MPLRDLAGHSRSFMLAVAPCKMRGLTKALGSSELSKKAFSDMMFEGYGVQQRNTVRGGS